MKINIGKFQDIETNIEINNTKTEQVKEFKYLEITLDTRGNQEDKINERI